MAQNYLVGVATGTDKASNPGTFLKGLCGKKHVLIRADCCPARASPSKSLSGFLRLRIVDAYQACQLRTRYDH